MSGLFTTIVYQPIFNLLVIIYNVIPGNDIGIAIIVLTVLIRLALYPFNKKALQSQKALQQLQPKVEEIKQKYANDRQEQGRALMELYKNEKINPLSSCLPVLIQLPFLLGVFYVFQAGLQGESLDLVYSFISRPETINTLSLGFLDLSKPSPILAVLAAGAQYWQSKMLVQQRPPQSIPGSRDEDMTAIMNKQMVYFLPIMTVVLGFTFPAGLTLYWLVTTLFSGAQQLLVFKKT